MKKKEQKRFESTAFILLEVLAKAVEVKKLQNEELKLKIDREKWLEGRSGQKVGSQFPSGGFISGRSHSQGGEKYYNKDGTIGNLEHGDFVFRKRDYKKIVDSKNSDEFTGVYIGEKILKALFPESSVMTKNEVREQQLENNLKTEKKWWQNVFDSMKKTKPVGEPLKNEVVKKFEEGKWYKSMNSNSVQFNRKNGKGDGINDFGTVVNDANWLNGENDDWRLATFEEADFALKTILKND